MTLHKQETETSVTLSTLCCLPVIMTNDMYMNMEMWVKNKREKNNTVNLVILMCVYKSTFSFSFL